MDDKIKDTIEKFTNTEDSTSEFAQEDIDSNKGMAVLSYLGILFLVPLFAARDSMYARFHLNQGIILFIANIASGIILGVSSIILIFIPFIGILVAQIIELAISALVLILMIIGIVNAATGKAKKLPLIGNLFTIIK